MLRINSYDEYSAVLSAFKQNKSRCDTNKIRTREEITDLIEAGKLFYEENDGVLWLFVDEGYYYYTNFYAPRGLPLHITKQNLNVVTDIVGTLERYNSQWEKELIATGFEKRDTWLQYSCDLDKVIEDLRAGSDAAIRFWQRRGFYWRKATKQDYPEFRQLMEEILGKERHTITAMTDRELNAMEQDGSCDVICDSNGKIQAVCLYQRRNNSAHALGVATYYKKSGLGAFALYQSLLSMRQSGCLKYIGWVRDNNRESLQLHDHIMKQTGKFYTQFLYRSTNRDQC